MTAAVTASLFGVFRLERGAEDVRPRGRKTCGLLAYLIASERRSAARVRLADLLWSDRGEQQARNSLRQALSELRGGPLGDVVEVSRASIGVPRGSIVSDSDRMEALARDNDGTGLAAMLSRIEGGYLDDLDGLSPAYDEWLQGERARQRDWLFSLALGCAAGIGAHNAGVGHTLLGELERLDPLREAVVRMRMRLDHVTGDVAALHRRYRRLANDLSRELNVAPSRETREMFESLVSTGTAGVAVGTHMPQHDGATPSPPIARSATRTPPVVAVSPFRAAGDSAAADIAASLDDAVCTSLSHGTEFRVVAVDTADTDQLAALFGRAIAGFALRGSVREVGGTMTVTAQLSNVETGFLVWSEQFRTAAPDADWLDGVTERIAGAVGAGIERDAPSGAGKFLAGTQSEEIAGLYSLGKRLAREARTMAAVNEGMTMLERVIALDPRHVGARLVLAQLHNTDCHYLMAGHDYAAMRAKALALAMDAADIEPGSLRVRLRLAWCRLRQGDWARATELFLAAKAEMHHDPDAINQCGFGLAQLGHLEPAHELIQRAFRLNPFAPAEYHADFAVLKALSGEHALAEAHFEVCGEQRLFWQVIRLSNLGRLDRSAAQMLALQSRLVTSFCEIWVPPEPPGLADLLQWGQVTFCFQRAEHRDLIAEGLNAAWERFSPASLRGSS